MAGIHHGTRTGGIRRMGLRRLGGEPRGKPYRHPGRRFVCRPRVGRCCSIKFGLFGPTAFRFLRFRRRVRSARRSDASISMRMSFECVKCYRPGPRLCRCAGSQGFRLSIPGPTVHMGMWGRRFAWLFCRQPRGRSPVCGVLSNEAPKLQPTGYIGLRWASALRVLGLIWAGSLILGCRAHQAAVV